MLVGYARVSTEDQSLDTQIDALEKAGCQVIYSEHESGKSLKKLKELNKCLSSLKPGDTLIVYQISRLGRSMTDLLYIINYINENGMQFRSVLDAIDTKEPFGNFMFQVMGAFAEYERKLIGERTKKALEVARKRNNITLGATYILNPIQARDLIEDYNNKVPIDELRRKFNIGRSTIFKYIARAEEYGCKVVRNR